MEPRYDRHEVQRCLNKMAYESTYAFGLSCAERLWGNYKQFSTETKWGDASRLRFILDNLWLFLGGQVSGEDISRYREECESLMPETEDFQTILVSSALDAASAALLLIDSLPDQDRASIGDISSLCIDTVDMFIQEELDLQPSDPVLETRILEHELMQRELTVQRLDLNQLLVEPISQENISVYRSRWKEPARSNLGF
jgi:uncharacterized protein